MFLQLNSSITKIVHKHENIKEEYALLQSMRTLKTIIVLFLFMSMLFDYSLFTFTMSSKL